MISYERVSRRAKQRVIFVFYLDEQIGLLQVLECGLYLLNRWCARRTIASLHSSGSYGSSEERDSLEDTFQWRELRWLCVKQHSSGHCDRLCCSAAKVHCAQTIDNVVEPLPSLVG